MKTFLYTSLLLIINQFFGQHTIQTIDRFTNSYQNKTPKNDVYLVIAFPEAINNYFFNEQGEALITIQTQDGKKEELVIRKADMYLNKKNGLSEYYYKVASVAKLREQAPFKLIFSSTDKTNYSIININQRDQKKMIKRYHAPKAGASNRKKLKHFKKTGNSQGQLMGASNEIIIRKRKKCSVKKREFAEQGIF